MEFSDSVKIEADRKVLIDLDDGTEDAVVDWHLEMKRFFDENAAVVGENNLVDIMKEYIKSITSRAIHFEDIETLKVMVEKHIEHIYWLYKDLDLRFSDTYLENMEHIITFYLNLILRLLLTMKKKVKVTQTMVSDVSKSVIKRISSYLLESEYHIFHVLIRQTINYSDNLVKDVLNILQSNICKQLFKNLYMHYLFSTPLMDKSDEAFCRVYIIFENWKAFEGNRQDEQIDRLMKDLLGRGSECIKDNKFLMLILKPQASVISELMRTVGCDPGITKSYFDYIKSRQKQDLEILDDIEKLALEDRGWEDDDDDDEEYSELFEKMVGDNFRDFIGDTQNNTDVKDGQQFKSPPVEQDDEVIYCGSDSDSDIEIVSIKPSSSYGKGVNVPQRLYIQELKNTGTVKPPKTSFLDSISIDSDAKGSITNSKREHCISDKNLRPNPLSQVFRNAEVNGVDDPKPYEVDDESYSKHDTIISEMSNQECHSETVKQLENLNINLSSTSETESSQDLEITSNNTLKSTTGQFSTSSLQDNSAIDESSRDITDNDVLMKIRNNINDLNINMSNPIANSQSCELSSFKICGNVINDASHCSQVSLPQVSQELNSGDSCSELPSKSSDGKAHIKESRLSISNTLQREVNEKESSSIIYQTNTLKANNKSTEVTHIQISTTDIHVCHCSKLLEHNSLSPRMEREGNPQNLLTESYVDPKIQLEKESLKDPCPSLNKDSSKGACDVNSNVSTLSLESITSSQKEDENLIENSSLPVCRSTMDEHAVDQTSCGTKVVEVSNQSKEPSMEFHALCNSDEPKHVTENSLMVSRINGVNSEKIVDREVGITNYNHVEDVNYQSDNQFENRLYKQISLHSDEQLDIQSFPSEMQIDYPANVKSVCKSNNVIDQNGKGAQTVDSVESSKSETENSNLTIIPEKSVRCNGTDIIKEIFKKDITLRKGEFRLLKRRHSDSNVYERSGSNRWDADFMCEKFDFKAAHADSSSRERVHASQLGDRVQSSMFLDTGQVVAPPPIDTGQSQVIAELSPRMTDPGEEPVTDSVNHINQKTAQHMCSVKRTKSQSDKDELCGYPTPPGSEEDIDDTQPDPVYSKIFPTPACSTTGDCYRSDRTVFRLNSDAEQDVTVDDGTTTVTVASQIRSTDSRKDLPAETVVPDIVYNEQTMSENDFLTEEIDPRDSMVSLEEEELLERLSDEERNEENETVSRNLAKSFAQIARDAVCDHDPEDSPKHASSVHESGLDRNATPSPSKAEMPENFENLADMTQLSENCEQRYFYDSPTPSSKKRKRQLKDVRFQDSQKAREKSQIKKRKMARKVETRIKSFDEFEADVWNRQSPIGKFAYDYDTYESDTDETTSQLSNLPNTTRDSIETTAAETLSSPIAKHVRVNGSSMNLQSLSCSSPVEKHPPLKGILKKVEQSHSYHPLHPVDDDPTSPYVYIHVEPDPDIGRGKMRTEGSWIKVSRKSLNAYKVSRNYKKLFERYPRVCVNCVNYERRNISDPSKRLLRKTNLELSVRIDYNKGTNDHKISFLEQQPAIDESSTTVNTRNPSFEIGLRPGTVNLSNEIFSIESTDDDLSHAVQLHIPPLSPCLSPTSNASSEFSDPTNLIPYQDIERALQVVEPDDQTCYNSSAEQNDSLQRHSGADVLDNMSVEAIKLLSNNADFHKIFSDFEGEILIENVPVLETEETENILNIDGTFLKLAPKVDVRLSDKLSDDLILNLKSDEELLKKICQELETNSLVYSLSDSSDNAAVVNSPEILHFSGETYQASNRLPSSANEILPTPESDEHSVDEKEGNVNSLSQNSMISSAKSELSSPTSFLPNSSEDCLKTVLQENILQNNLNLDAINVNVESVADIQVNLPSNSHISTQVSHCSLANNHYFQSAQINTQSFQNSQVYQTPQVSAQIFQRSLIGQPLICSAPNDPSLHQSVVGNLSLPADSFIELSHNNSVEKNNCLTTQNSIDISASNLSVTAMSNASFYSSLNPLQVITGALEPLQTNVVSAQCVQKLSDDVSPSVNNVLLYSSGKKKKAAKRGRPPKKSKKTKEKSHATSNHVKRPAIADCYQDRVPPIYHQELLPTPTYIATDQGKSVQKPAGKVKIQKKVNKESVITDSNRTSSVANVQGKQKLLPMPVPQTFNFETDTLKQEVYNIRLESSKVENSENDAEFETHLPLKKRKLSIPVPITSSSLPTSKPTTSTLASLENVESNEISYPATPMLSIADFYIPASSRPFKTPAEKKQLPVDPSPLPPIRYDLPNDATPFTCNMNTFNSNVYYLNECPYNVKLDGSSYCPPPPVLFPPESFGRSN